MKLFFADDSTQKSVRNGMGKLIAFGGVIVDEKRLRSLNTGIDAVAESFGVPEGEEFKWSPKKKSWIYKNLVGVDRKECYSAILETALDHETKAIVIVWDTGRTTLKGNDAFEKCVSFLYERLSVYLEKNDSLGLIIADKPGGSHKEDEAFLENFIERTNSGTKYVPPNRIGLNVLTTPSHLLRHLQLADLVTGITTAMVAGAYKYAKPLFNFIKPMFVTNYLNCIAGTGLKLFPNELINIYYWILGEDTFWRVGMNCGWSLPDKKWPYAEKEFE